MKDALRSCLKGIGPDKRCPAMDLVKVCEMNGIPPVKGGPRFPKETVIVFGHFACREIEASLRQRSDLKFDTGEGCGTLSLSLPASKTDPKGNGTLRRLGCTCSQKPERCVVKAAGVIFDHGTKAGASDEDLFLGTEDHTQAPTKAAMIETFRAVARNLGWKDDEVKALTGHTLRATGAQYLARCGALNFTKFSCFVVGAVTRCLDTSVKLH